MVLNLPTTSSMLSRNLGHSNGRPSSLPVKAKSGTSATTSTMPAKKRRGFGLFSDDEEDEAMGDESKKLSVSFSGNKSGFEKIEKVKGKGRMSLDGTDSNSSPSLSISFPVYTPQSATASRNSRNSSLITPKRSGRAPRSTPYSTTTSRALQRAKAASQSNGSVDNHEAQLISDTSYEEPSDKRSPYTMHGAKEYDDGDEVPTDEDPIDVGLVRPANEYSFTITPSRNLFTKTPSPVKKTPTRSPKEAPSTPATGKKTWGQWLGSILPESVKKPVKAILGAPEDDPYDMEAKVITPTKELVIGTPKKDNVDDENDDVYSLPGSFGKPEPKRPSPSSMTTSLQLDYRSNSKTNDHYDSRELSQSFGGTPTRVNDSGLFIYDKPKITTSTAPSRRERRSTMSTPLKHSKPTIEVSSLRKPNNFIERMRSAKKTPRYDPYARKSTGSAPPKEKVRLTQEEETELTPEEKLKLLKQRQKERKIAELEDKYEMREALKALGQPIPDDDDEIMPDSDTEAPKDKGKGKEKETRRASLNPTVEEAAEEASTIPSSPGSPPKTSPVKRTRESPTAAPSRNLFTPSKPAPSFLLNTEVKPGDIPFKINTAPPPTDAPTINFNAAPAWSFASDTSDKENISDGPPPPPTMSHATLPAPLTASASPPVLSGGLFGSQPAGGFGLGVSPAKETPLTPFQRQKNAAERFKPTAPSSLRESRCADEDEKENVPDKENAGEGSSSGKGEKKGLSQQQGQSSGSGVFAKAALKENAGVLNMGKSEVKIDVRAQVEGIPIKQLSSVMVWPVDSSFGSQVMKDAVASMWTGKLSEYPAGFGELFAQSIKY